MDIEFHYYMTFLIAGKAGFGEKDAYTIAYTSQHVDDNDIIYEINKDTAQYYRNYISQTMNITKPKAKLFRIYPLFHFIPGDPLYKDAYRRDGVLHLLNTTPDSENANNIIDSALKSKNLYRIGIASHAYVDTWAHQNFIGYYNEFNSMSGMLEKLSPNIGHADAGHNPDWPALVWQDKRLVIKNRRIDNKERFMSAAGRLFEKYRIYIDKNCSKPSLNSDRMSLIKQLRGAIGGTDQHNDNVKARIEKYKEVSQKMLGFDIPAYDEYVWFENAVNEQVRGLRDKSDNFLTRWDPLTDIYTWKTPEGYTKTDWFRFQEAVKTNQEEAWEILNKKVFSSMDLVDL
jgi:hypothetical protein